MYVYIENNDNYIYKEKASLTTSTGLKLANKLKRKDKKFTASESGYELEVGQNEKKIVIYEVTTDEIGRLPI